MYTSGTTDVGGLAAGAALGAGIVYGGVEGDSTIIDLDFKRASIEIYIPEGEIVPNGVAVSIRPGLGSSLTSSETKKQLRLEVFWRVWLTY